MRPSVTRRGLLSLVGALLVAGRASADNQPREEPVSIGVWASEGYDSRNVRRNPNARPRQKEQYERVWTGPESTSIVTNGRSLFRTEAHDGEEGVGEGDVEASNLIGEYAWGLSNRSELTGALTDVTISDGWIFVIDPARELVVGSEFGSIYQSGVDTVWQVSRIVSPSALTTGGESVFVHGGSTLYCLDRTSGEQRWMTELDAENNLVQSSVAFDGERLLASDGRLKCFDPADGSLLWEAQSDGRVIGDIVVSDRTANYITTTEAPQGTLVYGQKVRSVSLDDGTENWAIDTGVRTPLVLFQRPDGDRLCWIAEIPEGAPKHRLFTVDVPSGRVVTRFDGEAMDKNFRYSTMFGAGDRVVVKPFSGRMIGFDIDDPTDTVELPGSGQKAVVTEDCVVSFGGASETQLFARTGSAALQDLRKLQQYEQEIDDLVPDSFPWNMAASELGMYELEEQSHESISAGDLRRTEEIVTQLAGKAEELQAIGGTAVGGTLLMSGVSVFAYRRRQKRTLLAKRFENEREAVSASCAEDGYAEQLLRRAEAKYDTGDIESALSIMDDAQRLATQEENIAREIRIQRENIRSTPSQVLLGFAEDLLEYDERARELPGDVVENADHLLDKAELSIEAVAHEVRCRNAIQSGQGRKGALEIELFVSKYNELVSNQSDKSSLSAYISEVREENLKEFSTDDTVGPEPFLADISDLAEEMITSQLMHVREYLEAGKFTQAAHASISGLNQVEVVSQIQLGQDEPLRISVSEQKSEFEGLLHRATVREVESAVDAGIEQFDSGAYNEAHADFKNARSLIEEIIEARERLTDETISEIEPRIDVCERYITFCELEVGGTQKSRTATEEVAAIAMEDPSEVSEVTHLIAKRLGDDESRDPAIQAIQAVGEWNPAEIGEIKHQLLEQLAEDTARGSALRALRGLAEVAPGELEDNIPAIGAAVSDDDESVQWIACEILSLIGTQEAMQRLREARREISEYELRSKVEELIRETQVEQARATISSDEVTADTPQQSRESAGVMPDEGNHAELPAHEVLKSIGAGGNADVKKIRLTESGDVAALKVPRWQGTIAASVIEEFQTEATTWSRIDDNDHIVDVLGSGTTPYPWILLEYMPDGNFRTRLDRDPPTPPETKSILLNLCHAVRHAHRHGIVHADLKPENVLFRGDTAKVGDWGLARVLLEHSTSIQGMTPNYAAPEQLDPEEYGSVDNQTDVYQLGVIAYEALTGSVPYDRSNPAGTIAAILSDDPVAPTERNPALPSAVDDVVLTAMAKPKADRYESVLYFRDELRALNL